MPKKAVAPLYIAAPNAFLEENPTVEKMVIKFNQRSITPGVNVSNQTFMDCIPQVPCSNQECKQGGYRPYEDISEMLKSKEVKRKAVLYCSGWQGYYDRKKPVIVTKCGQRAEVEIKIKYCKEPKAKQ